MKEKLLSRLLFIRKISKIRTLIPSALLLLVALILAIIFMFDHLREDVYGEASGRADVGFRVFYLENEKFPYNPIPYNLQFLMAFTDYIEVDSYFVAHFSEEVEVYYNYTATKRLAITHMLTADAELNPSVFETQVSLSDVQGQTTADHLSFPGGSGEPGGTYTVFPRDFYDYYFNLIEAHNRMMEAEGVMPRHMRGFSADIFIDFEYVIIIPEWDIRETVTQGYNIPLTIGAFFLTTTSNNGASFERHVNLRPPLIQPPLFAIVLYVAVVVLSLYGLFYGIRKLQVVDPNERKQEALTILKKYSNEIAVVEESLNLTDYIVQWVRDFETLLSLTINLNKHIDCYESEDMVEFAVIVEDRAYYFKIDYFNLDEIVI